MALNTLTRKQLQVLQLLVTGMEQTEIARQLGVSASAVHGILSNAKHSMRSVNLPQMVYEAAKKGLI